MNDQNKVQVTDKRKSILPWVLVGILLLLVIGGGVYIFLNTKNTPSMNRQNPGAAMQQNPALQAAMQIMRLQRDSQMALTSDQVAKVKPILQTLIDTADPSQDFLQQQADAINKLLSDQQKSSLNSQRNSGGGNPNGAGGNPNGSGGNANGPGGNPKGSGGFNGQGGAPNGNGDGRSSQPQDLYKQVLDSLK